MKRQEKLIFLRNFKEDRLTANVIRPLLEEMGFKNITLTHGVYEKGKDLVFYKKNEFDEREYTGVQVKAVDIHGRAGESGNATEILNQAQQAFTHQFQDIYDNKTKHIDKLIVMTSAEIIPSAAESICHQLQAVGCYKTIQFFDGNKLVDLLNKWMPDIFWEEYDYFNRYFKAMKADFEKIKDISAIGQKEPVHLEDIYVSLKLSEQSRERHMTEMPEEMAEKIFDEKIMEAMERERGRKVERRRVIDPDTAIKQFHRMVILGAPGAGKTTLLKHLALKCCKENMEKQERLYVPVPITLREFFESGKALREYIDAVFEKYGFPEAKKFVDKELKSGKCILLLDGFDELAARKNQEKVSKEIHAFIEKHRNCKVLVTSRIAGYHDELSGFTRIEVMEFDKDQIKRFIHNWFGEAQKNKAQSMLKAVVENDNIQALARNPLMIAIIAIIYEEDRELPQRRADLYKRAVDVLLSKWDVQRRIKSRFKVDQKEFILKKLAFQCHCRNWRLIKEEEILKEIERYSPKIGLKKEEAKPFLEEIWQRSYLLRQIAMDTYDFLHLSFQEYFTALELKEQEDGIGTIIKHISEPWWEEPILLYAGISKDAGPLIKRIQKQELEDKFFSHLMLAGKCIADAEFTDAALEDEIAEKIWIIYEKTEEIALLTHNKEVGNVLRRMRPRKIINGLLRQLTDQDSSVRWRAASALGALGFIEGLPSLQEVLKNDENYYARERAASALGVLGSTEALPSLQEALENDKNYYVRGSTADALGSIGSEAALVPLIQALTQDKESSVRWRAANALGSIGSEAALVPLIRALIQDKESSVRWRAANALGSIANETAIQPLKQALKDRDWSVRNAAFEALKKIDRRLGIRIAKG